MMPNERDFSPRTRNRFAPASGVSVISTTLSRPTDEPVVNVRLQINCDRPIPCDVYHLPFNFP